MRTHRLFVAVFMVLFLLSGLAFAQPQPGDVFREHVYRLPNRSFSELDPTSKRREDPNFGMAKKAIQVEQPLEIDLDGATRAELSVEYWGGHIGTTEQKFRLNGSEWIYLPQPVGTKGEAQCYHRTLLGNNAVDIPLDALKDGMNAFVFAAGPQTCYNFDWGFYWIYSFTVRLYYDEAAPHPNGRLLIQAGDTLNELPVLMAEADPSGSPIRQVDFIGYYDDFDWDGDGVREEWQYVTDQGVMMRNIGVATAAPFQVRWNTSWIPDQTRPVKLALKLTDQTGLSYMTPAVENVIFFRPDWAVKMYLPADLPERFSARNGSSKSVSIAVGDDLEHARTARLIMSSWSARTNDGSRHEVLINGHKLADNFGKFHDHSFDELNVPLEWLKQGENEISVSSDFKGHALEINWPGPALLIAYAKGASTH